jgi:hypothetical protein
VAPLYVWVPFLIIMAAYCAMGIYLTRQLWGRFFRWGARRHAVGWLLRRLVRWLRRDRYARMAARIGALELELGMREPTTTERGLKALADASVLSGVGAYWTAEGEAAIDAWRAAHKAAAGKLVVFPDQHASNHARNFFANSDMGRWRAQGAAVAASHLIAAGYNPADVREALEATEGEPT